MCIFVVISRSIRPIPHHTADLGWCAEPQTQMNERQMRERARERERERESERERARE